ncbi:MAG: ornithine cyclodeaminase family protein, partial [Nitrososphaerota archaeon]
ENGAPHLICDAKALTGLRTGAATAISIKYLARKDSKVLGIIGCGYQAKWQLLAATKMLNFEEIKIYDIDREKMLNFKQNFKEVFDDRIKLMSSVDDLVNSSDVIITATTSRYPFVKKKQVKPGTHISAIGAYTPDMAEIEAELIAVSKLVVDSREAALSEAGDIIQAIKKGYITKDYIYAEIGEIIAGMKQGRANMDEITIFKSVGLSIQDAAAASLLLRKFRNLYS